MYDSTNRRRNLTFVVHVDQLASPPLCNGSLSVVLESHDRMIGRVLKMNLVNILWLRMVQVDLALFNEVAELECGFHVPLLCLAMLSSTYELLLSNRTTGVVMHESHFTICAK